MKKILLISAILISAVCYKTEAQVSLSLNIGSQPLWGPVGYNYVNYYYLPDLGVYYDVPRGLFVYFDFGRWNFAPALPARFGSYDLYNCYRVVINDRDPWIRNNYYYSHYASYRGGYQPMIRDSHDNRYFAGRDGYGRGQYDKRRFESNNGNVGYRHADKGYDYRSSDANYKHGGEKHEDGRNSRRIERKESRRDHDHDWH